MKTQLTDLLPDIVRAFTPGASEAGTHNEPEHNTFTYIGKGWTVEIEYSCAGTWLYSPGDWYTPESYDLAAVSGEVESVAAWHTDPLTGEETEANDGILLCIENLINLKLNN